MPLSPIVISKKQQEANNALMRANLKKAAKVEKVQPAPLVKPDPNLSSCIIIDVDGTLANRCDRGIYDFNRSIDDTLIEPVAALVKSMSVPLSAQSRPQIIIITGREQQFESVTKEWLNKYNIPFNKLFMRRTADRREASIVKEEIWAGCIRGKYNTLFIIDDNPKIIAMFRNKGILCLDVGSYEKEVAS